MNIARPRRRSRAALLAIASMALLALAAVDADAISKKKSKKTFGITTTTNKKFVSKSKAVRKPGKVVYSTIGTKAKAKGISKWKGWGTDEVTARVRKLTICDDDRTPKCFKAGGTLSFDSPAKARCKLGKKKKKRVFLYGRTSFEQDDEGQEGLRGVSAQYAVPLGSKPPCPKF